MSANMLFTKHWNTAGALVSPKRHDTPFKGAIAGPEGCFPFITFSYMYEMISMSKIKFGVDAGGACRVEEVRNEWNGVAIFLGFLFKATEINTKTEFTPVFFLTKRTGLFLDKENRSSVRRT